MQQNACVNSKLSWIKNKSTLIIMKKILDCNLLNNKLITKIKFM